jgi:hypothetical protein
MRTLFITASKMIKSPLFEGSDAELRANQEAMMKQLGWDATMKSMLLLLSANRLVFHVSTHGSSSL